MLIDADKVKKFITEPDLEIKLRPLLLFKGGLTPGLAKTRFNFIRVAMEAELPTMTAIREASKVENDIAHLCGMHAKYGWERMGMSGFFSRVLQSPSVLKRAPGLEDYIQWVVGNTHMGFIFPLQPIPETNIWSKRDWRRPPRRPRQKRGLATEFYPFISGEPTSDHDLLLTVEKLVPRGIPSDIRADICQDMLVSILTGEITLANLQDATPRYVKQIYQDMPSKYGHLSLDAPLIYGDGKSRTLGETII